MAEIWIPEHLRCDVGHANYHDCYFIDVKLKDGRVFRNLTAREGVCITGRCSDSAVTCDLPFQSSDIAAVRPYTPLVLFWATLLFRKLGRRVNR